MTPDRSARSGRPLLGLLTAVCLAAGGGYLLHSAGAEGRPAAAPGSSPSSSPAVELSAEQGPRARGPRPPGGAAENGPAPRPTPTAIRTGVPLPGDGQAADEEIQQVLEDSWPADLPAADERQLLADGRRLWRADVTGDGRGAWPGFFSGTAAAPSRTYTGVRLQAAIARRAGAGTAVVHLVWSGREVGGQARDGRVSDIYFTDAEEDGSWTPKR